MRWTLKTAELASKLVAGGVIADLAPKGSNDFQKAVLLTLEKDYLTLESFNGVMGMKSRMRCRGDGKGQFVVSCKLLSHVVSVTTKAEVLLEQDGSNWSVHGSGLYKFISLPPDQFTRPLKVTERAVRIWKGPAGKFVGPLLTMQRLQDDRTFAELNEGVFWDSDFSVVSRGAGRVSVYYNREKPFDGLLLLPSFGDVASRWIGNLGSSITIKTDSRSIVLESGEDFLVSRLLNSSRYPDCKRLIQQLKPRCVRRFDVRTGLLSRVLERVMPFSDTGHVSIQFTKDKAEFCANTEISSGLSSIKVSGPDISKELLVPGNYLQDLISVSDSDEVSIYLGDDDLAPMLFVPKTNPVGLVSVVSAFVDRKRSGGED